MRFASKERRADLLDRVVEMELSFLRRSHRLRKAG
jgi:hypothetical protein